MSHTCYSDEQILRSEIHNPVIKVIGLGGGGQNAIDRLIDMGMDQRAELIAANTDLQALAYCRARRRIQLGPEISGGKGAGGQPEVGYKAAQESAAALRAALQGADVVFLTAGMGGGTGTGAIAIAARIAREAGAVTIAVVTTPFAFEGRQRMRNVQAGLNHLRQAANTLIIIPNDRLLQVAPNNLPLRQAFRLADDVLRQAIQGMTDLISMPKIINMDFSNVREIMRMGGGAMICIGQGRGENKISTAIDKALTHPLMANAPLSKASGILINFTSGELLSIHEVTQGIAHLHQEIGEPLETTFGVAVDERLGDRVEVILLITGLGAPSLESTVAHLATAQPTPAAQLAAQPAPQPAQPLLISAPSNAEDWDVPAFMRRAQTQRTSVASSI